MTLAMLRPDSANVDKVMQETGMDRLQAWRHVQQRMYLERVGFKINMGQFQKLNEQPRPLQ